MSETEQKFNPDWDFMNDPELYRIQLVFEESLAAMGQGLEKLREAVDVFKQQFDSFFPLALARAKSDNLYLRTLIKFLRKNLRILDKGGLSMGRSEQHNIFAKATSDLIKSIGEKKYLKIITEQEQE